MEAPGKEAAMSRVLVMTGLAGEGESEQGGSHKHTDKTGHPF